MTTTSRPGALARPLPFTPESIKRLAPAADPELSSLAVSRAADGLSIWGLLDVPRLHCLQIFGSDTGQLRVTYLGQTQMVHAHGRGRVRGEDDPSFITSIQLIAAAMGLVTPQWYRPRALLGLADALIQAGLGGAILVSKRPAEEVRRRRIALAYSELRTVEDAGGTGPRGARKLHRPPRPTRSSSRTSSQSSGKETFTGAPGLGLWTGPFWLIRI